MKNISLILACTFEGGIGYNNDLPWYIKSDLKKFKDITSKTLDSSKQNAIIMGSKTYMSLPKKELPNRVNIVLTKKNNIINNNIIIFNNINNAIQYCYNNNLIENIFIIGGAEIYNIFLNNIHLIDNIYLTLLKNKYKCNRYILIDKIFENFNFENHKEYNFEKDIYVSYICKKKIKAVF